MEKWINRHNVLAKIAVRLASYILNPNPQTPAQHYFRAVVNRFKYLRNKLIDAANACLDLDIYSLQAIEILNRAGIEAPSKNQITTIEQLLRAK